MPIALIPMKPSCAFERQFGIISTQKTIDINHFSTIIGNQTRDKIIYKERVENLATDTVERAKINP